MNPIFDLDFDALFPPASLEFILSGPTPDKAEVNVLFARQEGYLPQAEAAENTPNFQDILAAGFTGEVGQVKVVGHQGSTYFVVGAGSKNLTAASLRKITGSIVRRAAPERVRSINILFEPELHTRQDVAKILRPLMVGAAIGSYTFSLKHKAPKPALRTIRFVGADINKADFNHLNQRVQAEVRGMALYRNLVNLPSNLLGPKEFALIMKNLTKTSSKFKIRFIEGEALQKEGYNLLWAVGKSNPKNPPIMAILEYNGDKRNNDWDVGLVGKGVTFDSGGNNMKVDAGMRLMKMDMGGAGCVLGLMATAAEEEWPINMVAIIGLADNLVSSTAMRPGDVFTTKNGTTVEIENTDAEGRLVMADCMLKIADYKPKMVMDIATLTGASRVALGFEDAALITTSDQIAERLSKLDEQIHDGIWRLPLRKSYKDLLHSAVADTRNSSATPAAGVGTAAYFLSHFVPEDSDWAHIDMSNVAKGGPDGTGHIMGGTSHMAMATGRPFIVLTTFLRKYYAH